MHLQPFVQGGTTFALQTTWNICLATSLHSHRFNLSTVATSPSASRRATLLKKTPPVPQTQLLVPSLLAVHTWRHLNDTTVSSLSFWYDYIWDTSRKWRDRSRLQLSIWHVLALVLESPRKAHSLEDMHNYTCFYARPPETSFFKSDLSLNI